MLRGIFFDLDDTLIGYEEAARSALLAGCAVAARANPAVNADVLAAAIQDAYKQRYAHGTPGFADLGTLSVEAFRHRLIRDAFLLLGVEEDLAVIDASVKAYTRAEGQALFAFPDTEETLGRLRPHFRLGLITNGPSAMQQTKLTSLALDGYFEAIVVDTEFGHSKPDVRIFQHAAERVGLAPDTLLFVGNSLLYDVAGAQAAGWTGVWLNSEHVQPGPTDPLPNYTIAHLSEFFALPIVSQALQGVEG